MAGLYFEEFELGQVFKHAVRRTVLESDNMLFCNMTHNHAALHIDHDYCQSTPFGKPLVNSYYTLALIVGLSVDDTVFGTSVANLGMESVIFPAPVFHGDTIRAETTILDKRESKSNDRVGIVTFEHRGYNQDHTLVCKFIRTGLLNKLP